MLKFAAAMGAASALLSAPLAHAATIVTTATGFLKNTHTEILYSGGDSPDLEGLAFTVTATYDSNGFTWSRYSGPNYLPVAGQVVLDIAGGYRLEFPQSDALDRYFATTASAVEAGGSTFEGPDPRFDLPEFIGDINFSATGGHFSYVRYIVEDVDHFPDWSGDLDVRTFMTVSSAIPEPFTWALMIVGFGGLGAQLRRRRRVAIS